MSATLERQAGIDFVLALRRRWADRLYPALQRQFDEAGDDGDEAPGRIRSLPAYPWFAWLERASQKQLWKAVTAAQASSAAGTAPIEPASLELDPDLELPGWYTEWDIHLQPGGVWTDDAAAAVYELGARLVMLGDNDDYQFHQLFTDTAVPAGDYARIVDLGCGFGKSTWPLKSRFGAAEVIGIDLAAPCLRLAARRAGERGLAIRFRQADARATGLEAGSVDLVTSTMLVHEMPPAALAELMREAARLLRPGGQLRFLDFQLTGEPVRDLAMLEHGARNNEPFMPLMMQADLLGMATQAGLDGARWRAFDERGAGLLPALEWPRRAEWHFPWAVLEAGKPA